MNKRFSKEDTQIATGETQIKTTVRYYFTPTGMAKTKQDRQ